MRMTRVALVLACGALIACGDDGGSNNSNSDASTGGGGPDAKQFHDAPPTTATMITVSGQATARDMNGATPLAGVTIEAFRNSDEANAIGVTTTDAQGNYSLTIQTNGESIDGFLKAIKTGYKNTYLYPPYPLMMDFNMATVIMVTPGTYDTLSNISGGMQQPGNGLVALVVTDGTNPVAGATVTSNPMASVVRYNAMIGSFVLPSSMATSTYTDGIAYLFNVPPGEVTVSAMHPTMTLASHGLKAWPDDLTTTVVVP